jgi:hypothetical protein
VNHVPHNLVNRTSVVSLAHAFLPFYPVNHVNRVRAFLESLPVTLLYSKADFRLLGVETA